MADDLGIQLPAPTPPGLPAPRAAQSRRSAEGGSSPRARPPDASHYAFLLLAWAGPGLRPHKWPLRRGLLGNSTQSAQPE